MFHSIVVCEEELECSIFHYTYLKQFSNHTKSVPQFYISLERAINNEYREDQEAPTKC
jgi:hypothetical protein